MTAPTTADRWLARPAAPVATAAVAIGCAVVIGLVAPDGTDPYPGCLWLALTGRQCPGCGTLRALHALTRGDVVAALDFNVLVVVLLPLAAWGWWRWLRTTRGHADAAPRPPTWAGYAALALVAGFWVARNLPWLAVLAA